MGDNDRDLKFEGTERYYLDPELQSIVNIALVMELNLTGVMGSQRDSTNDQSPVRENARLGP